MKVKTQVPCERCEGEGYIPFTDDGGHNCGRKGLCLDCKGKGYQEAWNEQLAAQIASYEERIEQLEAIVEGLCLVGTNSKIHIKRLEQIVLSMAAGSESSGECDVFPGHHTHWVYPISGSKVLLEEIKNSLAPSPDPSLGVKSTPANQASKKADNWRTRISGMR